MKTTSSNSQFYALQHVPAKKMRKNFTVSANIPIFAASKTYSGMRSRRPNRTAIFVSTPYRNINTTTPCRECGNAPGGSAISTLTTRSVVFFCQKLIVMKTNQTALSRPSGIGKNWRAALRLLLASQVRIDDEVYTVRQFISGILAFFLLFAAIVTAETCLALSFFFLAAAFPVARPIMYHEQQKGGSHEH